MRPDPAPREVDRTRAVLAALFEANFDAVFGFCLARCGSRQLAEEIASDVFVDAVRSVGADPSVEIGRPWLFAVARRRTIDHWRRAARHTRRIERLMQVRSTEPLRDGDDNVSDGLVLDALASLPERQRAVLVLRYLDDMSVAEVSDALGISYQATESLLARARRSFATAYHEGGR